MPFLVHPPSELCCCSIDFPSRRPVQNYCPRSIPTMSNRESENFIVRNFCVVFLLVRRLRLSHGVNNAPQNITLESNIECPETKNIFHSTHQSIVFFILTHEIIINIGHFPSTFLLAFIATKLFFHFDLPFSNRIQSISAETHKKQVLEIG